MFPAVLDFSTTLGSEQPLSNEMLPGTGASLLRSDSKGLCAGFKRTQGEQRQL
jgi:hypothetical protein